MTETHSCDFWAGICIHCEAPLHPTAPALTYSEEERIAAIAHYGFDRPELPKLTKFGMTVRVRDEDWVCEYCEKPLGDHAVTTLGGYAHRECEPLFSLIDAEISRSLASLPSRAQSTDAVPDQGEAR